MTAPGGQAELTRTADGHADQYTGLATRWDELVDWRRRGRLEEPFLAAALQRAPGRTLLDIACGTGFHSVLGARLGCQVEATDASPVMVAVARENFDRLGVPIIASTRSWAEWADRSDRFDAVVCLGSSFPHADATERAAALRTVFALLRPGGVFVLDHRNFDYIVDHGQLPGGTSVYGPGVEVSLLRTDSDTTTFGYRYRDGFCDELTVHSVRFAQLRTELIEAGFDVVSFADRQPATAPGDAGFCQHWAGVPAGRGGLS